MTIENTERLENIVTAVSGVAAAVCFTLLFFAMSAPVVETVLRYLS